MDLVSCTDQHTAGSEEEEDEENGIAPAYSMTDMTGELDDEEDVFEDARSETDEASHTQKINSQTKLDESLDTGIMSSSPDREIMKVNVENKTENSNAVNLAESNQKILKSSPLPYDSTTEATSSDHLPKETKNTIPKETINKDGVKRMTSQLERGEKTCTSPESTIENELNDQTEKAVDQDPGKGSVTSESTVKNEPNHVNDQGEKAADPEIPPDRVSSDSVQCRTLKHDYVNDPTTNKLKTLDHDYEPIFGESRQTTFTREEANIYENVDIRGNCLYPGEDSADEWGSSEFEPIGDASGSLEEERSSQDSYQDLPAVGGQGDIRRRKGSDPPSLPARNKAKKRSSKSADQLPSKVKHHFARLTSKSKKDDSDESEDDDFPVIETTFNMDKHPPPKLEAKPNDLTQMQEKRRLIVSSIVDTENSYLASLRRIVQDYEQALMAADPKIIRRNDIKTIFYKVKDILQCHNMFRIELTATIEVWDEEEKIGCVFNGSFSKSMVFEAYSAFVNNFSVAMETAKKQMTAKPAFADFLKQQLLHSPDKLSLFGLMVKPVQRFPQFILLLQDLLKYTPHDHHDRRDLQMALTELETLTHKLNDTKRDSESRHDVNRIIANVTGKCPIKKDEERFLIRKDNMVMTSTMNGETKSKNRRLILLNDQLLCVSCHHKDMDTGCAEKYKLKWNIPIHQVQVVESTFNATGKSNGKVNRLKFEPPDVPPSDHPHKKDLDDLLHDLPVIDQIRQLVTSLRFKYQTLTLESLQGITRHLQLLVRQKTDIDQCTIRLSLPTRHILTSTDKLRDEVSRHIKHAGGMGKPSLERPRNTRSIYTFQVHAPSLKQDWLLELRNAKLALEPANCPGWHLPEGMNHFLYKQPLFIKTLPVDITKPETQHQNRRSKKKSRVWIQCATPIMLPSHDQPGVGIQHLWVCSGEKGKGHITIVSLHGGEPYAIESFRSGGSVYVCAEMAPGVETEDDTFDDMVWIATEDNKIQIYKVIEENRRGPKLVFDTPDMVTYLLYHSNNMYAGHHKGQLVIYSRTKDGGWSTEDKQVLHLGTQPVSHLLLVHNQVWASCGNHIHIIHQVEPFVNTDNKICYFKQSVHELSMAEPGSIECMVKAGVGLVVSFRNKDLIRLYHLKTLDFLQDINMTSVVRNFFEGRELHTDLKESLKRLSVTCLQASKGLLWIGTNVGCVMCLPLPRLEGVPRISGRSCVSFHAHNGPVRFLTALHCGATALHPPAFYVDPRQSCLDMGHGILRRSPERITVDNPLTNLERNNTQHRNRALLAKSADYTLNESLPSYPLGDTLKSISTPNLTESYIEDQMEDLRTLYGSLMRGLDMADTEIDEHVIKHHRHSRAKLTKEVGRQMGKVKNASESVMSKLKKQLDMKNSPKASTLPVLHEDGQSLSSTDGDSGGPKRGSQASSGEYCAMGTSDRDSAGMNSSGESHYENTQFLQIQTENEYMNSEESRKSYIRALSTAMPDAQSEADSKPTDPAIYPGVHSTSQLRNKAVVVISGGDGHINWNEPRAESSRYEDICLLLWQCRD